MCFFFFLNNRREKKRERKIFIFFLMYSRRHNQVFFIRVTSFIYLKADFKDREIKTLHNITIKKKNNKKWIFLNNITTQRIH